MATIFLIVQNLNPSLSQTITSQLDDIRTLEKNFYNASRSEVRVETLLSKEFFKQIQNGVTSCNIVQERLNNVEFEKIKDLDTRDIISAAHHHANDYCEYYRKAAELYEHFYSAYYLEQPEEFSEYVNDLNDLRPLARRLTSYFTTRDYWQEKLDSNGCLANETPGCREAERYYDDNYNTFIANASLARGLLMFNIPQPYKPDEMLYKQLEKLGAIL